MSVKSLGRLGERANKQHDGKWSNCVSVCFLGKLWDVCIWFCREKLLLENGRRELLILVSYCGFFVLLRGSIKITLNSIHDGNFNAIVALPQTNHSNVNYRKKIMEIEKKKKSIRNPFEKYCERACYQV